MNFSACVELKRQTLKIFYPEYGDMRMMSLGFVENAMQIFLLKYKISNIICSLVKCLRKSDENKNLSIEVEDS